MSRWTDDPAPQSPEAPRSRFRRLLDGTRDVLSGNGAAAGTFLRAGVAIGLVALAAVGAMLQGRSGDEPTAKVKTPTFKTVPVVRREPAPLSPSQAVAANRNPLLSPFAALPSGQHFLPRIRSGPQSFCEDLADQGFPGARWEPSQVFAGEWECAAPLRVDGEEQAGAFLVARGRRKDAVGSLMLRMNPTSEEEKRSLLATAARVRDAFASETGLLLPEEASKLLDSWTAGETPGIGGRMRLVVDRAKPDSRILNLSVEPRLASPPDYACDKLCFGEMRALAGSAETREVKSAEL